MRNISFNLQQISKLADGLWSVGQVFNQDDFEYIKSSMLAFTDDKWAVTSVAGNLRYEVVWEDEGFRDELFVAAPQIIPTLSTLFDTKIEGYQVYAWQDLPGFIMPYHVDDESAFAHFQIYVDSGSTDVGTDVFTTTGKIKLPFIPNTGYIAINKNNWPHGMMTPVKNSPRFSLDFNFTSLQKE